MANRYKTRAVHIRATQWDGTAKDAVRVTEWSGGAVQVVRYMFSDEPAMRMDMQGYTAILTPNDYVVDHGSGVVFPCHPTVFSEIYEEAASE